MKNVAPDPPPEQYRDRATERRELFPEKHMLNVIVPKHKDVFQQAAKKVVKKKDMADRSGLDVEKSVGSKLLQKMGWQVGQGIGKEGALTAINEAKGNAGKAGIGKETVESNEKGGGTYQEKVKDVYRARFEKMYSRESMKK
jgi:stalled ribosome alternative rescue factor ArfA